MQATARVAAGVLALSLSLGACAGPPGPMTDTGAVLGAITGGLIGANRGPATAVAGALIGGLIGGSIGNALDEEDRRIAYAAELDALERGGPGAPMSWRGPHAYGTIVAGPPYPYAAYQRCREYSHTIYIQGRPQSARGIACRNPDGTWTPVS